MTTPVVKINAAADGLPVLNAGAAPQTITLADVTGGTVTTRVWAILSQPGTLAAAPSLSSTSDATVTFSATADGVYIGHLKRLVGGKWYTTPWFVGVSNAAGLVFPSPLMSGKLLAALGAAAAKAGYAGSLEGATNIFLDAILRYLYTNVVAAIAGAGVTFATVKAALLTANTSFSVNGQKITSLGTPTANADAATKLYVDTLGGTVTEGTVRTLLGTSTGAVPVNGQKVTGLGTPTANTDAATKQYVDGVAAGAASAKLTWQRTNASDGVGTLAGGTVVVLTDVLDTNVTSFRVGITNLGGLTASDTNYATILIELMDSGGTLIGTIADFNTSVSIGDFTGDWVTLNTVLPDTNNVAGTAADYCRITVAPVGLGVQLPPGTISILF